MTCKLKLEEYKEKERVACEKTHLEDSVRRTLRLQIQCHWRAEGANGEAGLRRGLGNCLEYSSSHPSVKQLKIIR